MDVPEGMDIGHFKPMHEGRVIDVGVEVDHVQGVTKGADHRKADSVVASQHHQQCLLVQDSPGQLGDVPESPLHVGGQNVRIPNVSDPRVGQLVFQEATTGPLIKVSTSFKP
jgi:hypothetical protein